MIERLESAGLGFFVKATDTQQKLGEYSCIFSSPYIATVHADLGLEQANINCSGSLLLTWISQYQKYVPKNSLQAVISIAADIISQ